MQLMPLRREFIRTVPRSPGGYLIHLDGEVYYVGRSTRNIRSRLYAHARGRGSRMIRELPSDERERLMFEYYDIREDDGDASPNDIANFELFLMAMHTGERPPGNLRWDGGLLRSGLTSRREGAPMLPAWQLQEAKSRFSRLVEAALSQGPQVVTRHGQEVVVVIAVDTYRELTGARDFKQFLRDAPLDGLDLERDPDSGREVTLP